ncbi:protein DETOXIFICATION 43 [Prunus yedoensis var. nudiflora]|uniref:Protein DETOXIFICATION 43 n=1 Tax=Prunus yedoensis var. nudiflora TaxID=2094558 RepID=A0A315AII4_PRUYE|nr:protein DETOXIFICATION 43 [Prunus yedoensis var. nudiflora]
MAEEQDLHESVSKWKLPVGVFFKDARRVFKWDILGKEILEIAFPAALAVAADPVASLIDTAFIGHIGPVELAAAGVSIALFNQASRITIFPLVSITTSFVAEEDTVAKMNIKSEKGEQLQKADMLDDLEKGAAEPNGTAKENGKHLEKFSTENSRMEEASAEDDEHVRWEKVHLKRKVLRTTVDKRPSDLMSTNKRQKSRNRSDTLLQHRQHSSLEQYLAFCKPYFSCLQPKFSWASWV